MSVDSRCCMNTHYAIAFIQEAESRIRECHFSGALSEGMLLEITASLRAATSACEEIAAEATQAEQKRCRAILTRYEKETEASRDAALAAGVEGEELGFRKGMAFALWGLGGAINEKAGEKLIPCDSMPDRYRVMCELPKGHEGPCRSGKITWNGQSGRLLLPEGGVWSG